MKCRWTTATVSGRRDGGQGARVWSYKPMCCYTCLEDRSGRSRCRGGGCNEAKQMPIVVSRATARKAVGSGVTASGIGLRIDAEELHSKLQAALCTRTASRAGCGAAVLDARRAWTVLRVHEIRNLHPASIDHVQPAPRHPPPPPPQLAGDAMRGSSFCVPCYKTQCHWP